MALFGIEFESKELANEFITKMNNAIDSSYLVKMIFTFKFEQLNNNIIIIAGSSFVNIIFLLMLAPTILTWILIYFSNISWLYFFAIFPTLTVIILYSLNTNFFWFNFWKLAIRKHNKNIKLKYLNSNNILLKVIEKWDKGKL